MTQNRIETDPEDVELRPGLDRTFTIASHLSDTEDHYAVLPHGLSLEGWSLAEKQELNDHVRHMLHSRRAAFKRGMKGFGQYVRRRKSHHYPLASSVCTDIALSLSPRLVCHRLCNSSDLVRTCMGPLPDRLDQCWRPTVLYHQRYRQRPSRPLRDCW